MSQWRVQTERSAKELMKWNLMIDRHLTDLTDCTQKDLWEDLFLFYLFNIIKSAAKLQ